MPGLPKGWQIEVGEWNLRGRHVKRSAAPNQRVTAGKILLLAIPFTASAFGIRARADEGSSGSSQRPGLLSLHQLDAYFELRGEFRHDRVDTDARDPTSRGRLQKNREFQLEARVGLTLGGVIVDPGFLTFGADLSFALTRDRFRESGSDVLSRTDTDSGTLELYDFRLNFLPGKKLSGSLYGLRQDNRIARRFQPTLDERRTTWGTSWTLADPTMPMELSYDSSRTDRSGNRDSRDDEQFEQRTLHFGLRWLDTQHHRIKLSFEHAETEQEFQGRPERFETTRDLLIVEDEREFGDRYQHSLRTLFRWQDESGDFARDILEIGPQLALKHSDNLQTLYRYQFNRERYAELDIDTHRADFQLVHQMYSNLTTTVDLFGLREDIVGDVDTTQWGGAMDLQYNRRNPYGHLYANLALAYDREDASGSDGRRLALNEAHTFRDPVDVTLRNRNAVASTIVVTDTSNRRLYREGVDYSILAQGTATRIRRIRTGAILDGDTVLIDYRFETPADGRLDTTRVDFSVEQRFTSGLTPYYRLSFRHQEDDVSNDQQAGSSRFAGRADRTDHHRLGARYERPRYTLGAEFEIFDDTIDPYDAFHVNALLRLVQTPDRSLDASGRFSRLLFEGGFDDRNVTLIDLDLSHRWRLSDSMSTIHRLAYRFEDDSIAGDTHAWDVMAGFEYKVGDLLAEVSFRYDRLDLPGSEDEDFGIFFRLRRSIRDLLSRR